MRFLIADDNATARRLLRALMETREGWQVCGEGENGVEAVAKAAELKPDLVILDLAMPVMDGLHAAQAISAASPAIPILMCTMHHFASLELEAKKAGIRRVISKTASGDALLLAIEEALNPQMPQAPTSLPQALSETASSLSNGASDASAAEVDPNSKPN
jgi:two-component system, chemotaxis family, chemotaxis protein CheY